MEITEFDLTLKVKPYFPNFLVLFDPSVADVVAAEKCNHKTFIFIFTSGRVDAQVDFSGLPKNDYICNPIYLGCLRKEDIFKAAMQIVEKLLGQRLRMNANV